MTTTTVGGSAFGSTAQLPRLLALVPYLLARPGVRLDESVPGTGLGLAVVRDLAELYGGALRLDEAEVGLGGLRAELRLPAARG